MVALAVAALFGACGDEPADEGPAQTVTTAPATTTTLAPRSYNADLTTTDGYRYKVTLLVGAPTASGAPDECPGAPAPGKVFLPVTLTVANPATDRPAPFPPVRVETTAAGAAAGARPGQVQLRDTAGTCTFAPRVPSIPAGGSVTFKGTTPAVDGAATPGSAGRLEVKVSESTFSLGAPLP